MRLRPVLLIIATFCFILCGEATALAQGGWDVWTIYLRDGSRIDAAPVWSLNEKVLKYGMSGEVGEGTTLSRSQIVAMSRNVDSRRSDTSIPKLPEGEVEKDLAIMADGKQVSGTVLIRASKDESGKPKHYAPVLLQNGVEIDLRKVEHIKLAKPSPEGDRRRLAFNHHRKSRIRTTSRVWVPRDNTNCRPSAERANAKI